MDKMPEELNGSVTLPRKSACACSVPLRRSKRLVSMEKAKKSLEILKCDNSLVPDTEMDITSLQCPETNSGTNLKCSLDGKNIMASDSNNQKAKEKPESPREVKSEDNINYSIICTDRPSLISKKNYEVVKGPIIWAVWRGSFHIGNFGLLAGLTAHASKSASEEVLKLACHLPALLNFQMVSLLEVWPGYYSFSPLNDAMVDLNIFPENDSCHRDKREFEKLVTYLLDNRLAMKTMVNDIVILVFTSPQLPYEYWRASGNYYLWAVSSGNKAFFPQSQPQELHLCTSNAELLMDSNFSGNGATADKRDSCNGLIKEEEERGKKRMKCMNSGTGMKSKEAPLPIISRSPTVAVGENIIEEQLPAKGTINGEIAVAKVDRTTGEEDSKTLVEKCGRSTNKNIAGDQAFVDVPLIPPLCITAEKTITSSCLLEVPPINSPLDSKTLVEKCPRSTNENIAGDQPPVDVPLILPLCITAEETMISSCLLEVPLPSVNSPLWTTKAPEEGGNCGSKNQQAPSVCFQGGDLSLERQDEGRRGFTSEATGSQSIGASVFHMFDDSFDEVNSKEYSSAGGSSTPEQRYSMKPDLACTLNAIIQKHSDIGQDCSLKSSEMLSYAVERVCEVVKTLEALPFNKLQSSILKSLHSTIADAEVLQFNVKWLRDRYDELMDTVSGIQQYQKLKSDIKQCTTGIESKEKAVELKRRKMLKLQGDIMLLESEVEFLTAKAEKANNILRVV